MDLRWEFSSLAADYSREFPAQKERFWAHLLALALLFCNKHGRGRFLAGSKEGESGFIPLVMSNNFYSAPLKSTNRLSKVTTQVNFGRPNAWGEQHFIDIIAEANCVDPVEFRWQGPTSAKEWPFQQNFEFLEKGESEDFFSELDRLAEDELFGFLDER